MTPEEYYSTTHCPFCYKKLAVSCATCKHDTLYVAAGDLRTFRLGEYGFRIRFSENLTMIYYDGLVQSIVKAIPILTVDNYLQQVERLKKLQVFQ